MNLSDLKPTSYELQRVVAAGEVLCDIRLELRHDAEGPSRWRIVDVRGCGDELSSAGNWTFERHRPKNLKHYRFETPEAALAIWNRGVSLPGIMDGAEDHLLRLRGTDRFVAYKEAYERIKAACAPAMG